MAEGQADAWTALCRVFGVLRSLVRVHAVHPACISLEAHREERIVGKWDALRRALHTASTSTTRVTVVVTTGTLLTPSSVGGNIFLRPERHGAPRAKGEVHDARAEHDVDRLVRMFRDVVRARAVELYEHVIYGMLERALDVCSDRGYCGREGEQRWGFVGRMAVDRVAVAVDERDDFSLAGDRGCLLATGVGLALYGNQSRNFTTYRRRYAYVRYLCRV